MSAEARKRELIEALLRKRGVDPASLPITPRPGDAGPAPLSFAQERLWILEQFAPGRPTYNEVYEVRLTGRIDPAALGAALYELSRRHAVLRTTFEARSGTAFQRIGDPGLPMPVVDLSAPPEGLRSAEADRRGRGEAERSFDLARGPVARATLLRLGAEEHRLLLGLHHIVSDATSIEILATELVAIYQAFARGESSPLPEPPLQYADFAHWQRERLASSLETQLADWKERLAGAPTVLTLPSDRPRSEQPRGRGASLSAPLPGDLSNSVRQLARAQGATLFMTLLSAFDVLLYRYTGRQDLLVGTPIAGRTRAEVERVVGFFVNTLVLRANLAGDPTFAEILARNRGSVLAAYDRQDVPFGRLVEELRPERSASHAPLVQVMFLLHKPGLPVKDRDGLELEMRRIETGASKFDLTFLARDTPEMGEGIICGVEYDSDLFLPTTMGRLLAHFQAILEAVAAEPGTRLSQIPLLTARERQQVLVEWNDAQLDRPRGACIHDLFAARAASAPDAPALIFEGRTTSYGELNAQANRLARRLRSLGLRVDDLVGICLEPSPDVLAAVLGILKAGGAYVPLDAGHPAARLAWLLEDTGLRIVLTDSSVADRLPDTDARVIRLDEERDALSALSPEEPEPWSLPESLAYQIYTSGSTGRPKGVMVPHAGLVNLALSFVENWRLGPGDRMLMLHSMAFDASVGDLFPPLVSGAALVLHRNPQALLGRDLNLYLEQQGITCIELAAAFWQQWTEDLAGRGQTPPSTLRALVVGGESVSPEKVRTWYGLLAGKPFRLLNHYGPTEITVCASSFWIDEGGENFEYPRLPIGRPLSNVRLYLLDQDLQAVPAGVLGELCIGGVGVARGYLKRPDVTAERFIPNPFAQPEEKGSRLYRTGDQARHLPDGNLEFLGRVDQQVKIRGYRIEPGEVESVLAEHSAVREAVVLARADEPGPHRLVAYVVAGNEAANTGALRAFLKGKLPAHMVPEAFVFLDRLPINANGKVDRKAMPRPVFERSGAAAGDAPGAPETELQRRIAEVWRELLRVEKVGLHDNFFDLGGNSLLLIRMEGVLRDTLGHPVEVIDLFRHPTIAAFADHLERAGATPAPVEKPAFPAARSVGSARREIAIVGMTGRFPGAAGVVELWRNLRDGVESIRAFTEEELQAAGVPEELLADPFYIRAKGVLDDVECFDAKFFGFSPREAEILDPQHRIFLECAWEVLESCGYDPERYAGPIGVFTGVGRNSYFTSNLMHNPEAVSRSGVIQTLFGNDRDFLPTRVSYKLNLQGPSLVVQTACSSSLVAVHLACRSLFEGECDMALAGGATVPVPQVSGYFHEEGGIFSNDGHCRAFDSKAKGTVPGSGVAIVVLKRLEDALADGDQIHAVIKATAINNDGSVKIGYTAPSPEGQIRVIREALSRADVEAESITYLETHGTGTLLGDLIEVTALKEAFRPLTSKVGFCALGSLKTNVGHMDTAAGVGGLIKATLALAHRQIPPSLHFREANPKLDMGGSPFYVNTALRDWTVDGPRRAAVSSFGIGGTNAHAILEEAPAPRPTTPGRPWQLLTLSARSAHALDRAVQRLAGHLGDNPGLDLADVAFTLQTGRRSFEHRAALICRDHEEAVAALPGGGGLARGFCEGSAPQVVFLFPGSGSQRPRMVSDLYRDEPVFRAALERTLDLLRPLLGVDLRELLFPQPGAEAEAEARLRQPSFNTAALFAFCHALAELWMSWGLRPQAMIGHSLGEYVAACIAGVMPLESAVVLVAERGRLLDALSPGAMLSVPLSEAELAGFLGEELSLAAVNSPHLTVASGPVEAVDELERTLAARGLECRRIPVTFAAHSRMLDPMLDAFRRVVESLPLRRPELPYVSTATGTWITGEEATDPQYWVRHLRQTVRFAEGMAELRREPGRIFLEVGPGKTLFSLLRGQEGSSGSTAFASLLGATELRSDLAAMLRTLGGLWLHGVRPDWLGVHSGESRRRVALPTYPFEYQRYWIDALPETAVTAANPWQRRPDPGDWFWVSSWRRVPLGRRGPAEPPGVFPLLFEPAGPSGPGERLADRLAALGGTVDRAASVEDLKSRGLASRRLVWLHPAGADSGADRRAMADILSLSELLAALPEDQRPSLAVILSDAREVTGSERVRASRAALAEAALAMREWGIEARVLDLGSGVAVERVAEELLAALDDPDIAFRSAHRWVRCEERLRVDEAPDASFPRPESTVLLAGEDGEVRRLLEGALGSIGVRTALVDPSDLPAIESLRERFGRLDVLIYAAGGASAADVLAQEEARLGRLSRLAGELGAVLALAVYPLASPGSAEAGGALLGLAAAWIQQQGLPWRGAALENLPTARGEAWQPPTPDELAEVLRRLASLEPGSWVTVSTGDLPGRLAARGAAGSAPEEASAERPAAPSLHPRPALDSPYVPPRNRIERDLVELWQDFLGIEKIGVLDSFFDLGGDSVTSIQIVARANKAGYKLTQRKAFHHPTIAELAKTALLDAKIHAQQSAVEGPVHLIPIQQWFFEQDLAHPHQWNISALLKAEPPLLPIHLEAATRAVLEHHDALRLRFRRSDGVWRQTSIAPDEGPGSFTCIDLGGLPEPAQTAALEAAAADVQGSLDLTEGPLARLVLFRRGGEAGDRLLATVHHLVIDIPSWGILFEDLETAYGQSLRGETPELPSKTSSYKHWAITVLEYSRSGALDGEIPLWLDERRNRIDPLPVDLPGRNEAASSRTLTFTLPAEETQILTQRVTRAFRADVEEILLTALAQALAWWTGGRRFLIDIEGLGREPLRDDVDLSRTVGWFTSSYPLLLDLPETADPWAELASVRDAMRAVPRRGLGYGMLRFMAGLEDAAARLEAQPQPEIAFVYLGQGADGSAGASRFQPAPESAGPARHPRGLRGRMLSLSVQTGRDGLQLAVSYSENLHRRATIETIAQTFFAKLRRLAETCRAVEEGADPAALVLETSARELPESGPLS